MNKLKIDPEGYFRFDLEKGDLSYRDGGRLLAYPFEALRKVLETGLGSIRKTLPYSIGLHLGEECGRRVKSALGADFMDSDTSPEQFLAHLNAVLALHGLGMVSLETWGEALLVDWQIEPAAALHVVEFQEGVLAGVLSAATGEPFEAASVDEDGKSMRFLAGSTAIVDMTKIWLGEGCGLGEIVDRLHAGRHLETRGRVE